MPLIAINKSFFSIERVSILIPVICLSFKNLVVKSSPFEASKGEDLTTKFLNDKQITGISIDTRSIEKNDLFIAIKGKNYDGHDFIEKAIQKGASGIIVSCKESAENLLKLKPNGIFLSNGPGDPDATGKYLSLIHI